MCVKRIQGVDETYTLPVAALSPSLHVVRPT